MKHDVSNIEQLFLQTVRAQLGDETYGLWFEGQCRISCDVTRHILHISNRSPFGLEWYRRNYRTLFESAARTLPEGPFQVQISAGKKSEVAESAAPAQTAVRATVKKSPQNASGSGSKGFRRAENSGRNGGNAKKTPVDTSSWNRFQVRGAKSAAIMRDVERLNIPEVTEFLHETELRNDASSSDSDFTASNRTQTSSLTEIRTKNSRKRSVEKRDESGMNAAFPETETPFVPVASAVPAIPVVSEIAVEKPSETIVDFLMLMDRLDAEGILHKSLCANFREAEEPQTENALKSRKSGKAKTSQRTNAGMFTDTEKTVEVKPVKKVSDAAPAGGNRKLQELMLAMMNSAEDAEGAEDESADENTSFGASSSGNSARVPATAQPFAPVSAFSSAGSARTNSRYGSFETFVSGGSNRLAYTTAKSLGSQMGLVSPIVFFGKTGVGKTHLLDAVCRQVAAYGFKTVYTTGEDFMMEFVETVRDTNKKSSFLRTYRYCDLLIVDNLQFLLNKQSTTAEFLSIVANRMRAGRQIVLACDRPLEEMEGLGKDLCSYLRSGYWVQIYEPSFDVRLGILERQSRSRQIPLSDEQRRVLAESFTGDVRTILGAINTLDIMTRTHAAFPESTGAGMRRDLEMSQSPDLIEKFIRDLTIKSGHSVTLEEIKRLVAAQFGLDVRLLSSGKRIRKVTQPRMLAMWLARKYTRKPLSEIGQAFGCNSHSTVISAQKKVDSWLNSDCSLQTASAMQNISDIMMTLKTQLESAL